MNFKPWELDDLTPFEMDNAQATAKAALGVEQ